MFNGLSAFPLTPFKDEKIDEQAFVGFMDRLVDAGVDSIGVLGSTGSYMYLDRAERRQVIELAVKQAGNIPVMASISSLRLRDVLRLAEDAQQAGASALLLAPVSYQPLSEQEAYLLYEQVSQQVSVPICVYDNPRTTQFTFSDELHGKIAALQHIQSVKIPGISDDAMQAKARVDQLRSVVPDNFSIGISGDAVAVRGLNAGCEVWYSVLGSLFPKFCLEMTRHAQAGRAEEALKQSEQLSPIWALFNQHGSVRVAAAIAIYKKWISAPGLPLPLIPVGSSAIENIEDCLNALE
ncbi:dihydrodipicolinate synthase family protein [Saccharibacillus sp. JS10]|uniref:dihydrodipicolinate synthase family protein n=1 Tax=Saccharibacillus sp. JS10 TaxID=2950552 RepID=UPI00210C9747|nr:dihydrodipicolinate synthase family protein [Saccharibacillus sp. JS10]